MYILLINQFYPPDVAPTGRYLKELADVLRARGHVVEVLCSEGRYDTKARRSRLKQAGGFLHFYLYAYRRMRAMNPAPDVVLVLTTPPFIGWIAQRALRGRATQLAHWVMDVYPDVLVAAGMIGENGILYRCMQRWTTASFRDSACIVALGDDMAERLQLYTPNSSVIHSLPLWADLSEAVVDPQPSDSCCFQYAGNMGRGHHLKGFLAAAEALADEPGLQWVFSGEGPRKAEVEAVVEAHPELPIILQGYVPKEKLRAHLCAADVHLVSMLPAWGGCIMPSKIQAACALGRPVLFVGPSSSSPARWIRNAGAGWVVEPGDLDGLIAAVREALVPEARTQRGKAARIFAEQHFDIQRNGTMICEWLELL